MPNQEFPQLNGRSPSWADIKISATVDEGQLVDMIDIAAINWSRSLEKGEQRGASGGRVMKRTKGQGSQEASITFYRDGWRTFLRALKARAPTRGNQRPIGGVEFNITIQHDLEDGGEIYETVIKGCNYLGDSDDNAEGTDPSQVEVTISTIEIATMLDGEEVVLI